MNYISTLFW